jgi:hypothetical protein
MKNLHKHIKQENLLFYASVSTLAAAINIIKFTGILLFWLLTTLKTRRNSKYIFETFPSVVDYFAFKKAVFG